METSASGRTAGSTGLSSLGTIAAPRSIGNLTQAVALVIPTAARAATPGLQRFCRTATG